MPRTGRNTPVVPLNLDSTPNPPERFTPAMPDDGRELMMTWEVPPEDWDKLTVKTQRFRPGTQQLEIIFSCLPREWRLEEVAQRYGPGTYRIQAGPGIYRAKNTTITVSREYAAEAGYEPAPAMTPAPDPQQMMAARTAQQAMTGPVDPISLAQMIQTAVNTALAQAQPKTETSALELVMKGFEMANTMTQRSMESARTMLGVAEPAAMTPKGWAEVALELGPSLLSTLQSAMAAPRPQAPAPPPRPTIATHQPPPGEQTMPQQPPPQTFPDPPQETVPLLRIMQQYAGMLASRLDSPAPPENLAAQLAGLLGADLDPSVLATADHVAEHGPGILGNASPALATPKAAAVLAAWARILRADEETQP